MKILIIIFALLLSSLADAHTSRSYAAKKAFVSVVACPANGLNKLPCPGYVIDHVQALACGGLDDKSNMQWQTIAEGKAKDKWERKGCTANQGKN